MKILLIQPPMHPEVITFGTMEPLALETLSAAIKLDSDLAHQVAVRILDLRVEKKGALEKTLSEFNPNIVGITGITIDFPTMMQTAARVKEHSSAIAIVVGGHHATMAPQDFFRKNVDLIVRGPGVRTLPMIVKELAGNRDFKKIPGVIFQQDGNFTETEGWDSSIEISHLPIPDRSLTKQYRGKYRFDGFPWGLVTTSQGCPFRCTFCACWKVLDGRYIARDPEDVVEEFARVPEKRIFIGDDHTFGNIARADAIAELVRKRGLKKTFQAYSRADAIARHPQTFKRWAEIGLFALTVGFEALRDEDLAAMNKKGSVEINERANKILVDCGIHNYAHILLNPAFDNSDFRRIGEYVFQLGILHPVFPVLTPLPGTELRKTTSNIFPDEHQYYDLGHPILPTTLSPEEFYAEMMQLFCKNYSVRRWLAAKAKKFMNFATRTDKYPWNETRAPEWYTIPIARRWISRELSPNRLNTFLSKFKK
ncbi:B12-binding domain-containing radical SAM protein [Patescibacteria group bacterium]|nr:B12-binding domain-containing radical SAM protein [Patescibacteria group bacterium]